jgi:hypothetical protein
MKVIAIITLILLMNCKISKGINQEECETSKYCTVNIHIADSLYENSEPFTVIKELNNPLNGAMTDFKGNATLMGSIGGDTIYLGTKKCIDVYNYDYYSPQWYRDYSKKNPLKIIKYNPDLNYDNKK